MIAILTSNLPAFERNGSFTLSSMREIKTAFKILYEPPRENNIWETKLT
jgi:hypothetical protein